MCDQVIACADEAQQLLVTGQYAAAAVQLQRAIGLGLLDSHAHEAWLLIYGKEDVAINHERAIKLAEEGTRLGCLHCQGVLAYCFWGGYGCDADVARSLVRTTHAWKLAKRRNPASARCKPGPR